MARLTKSDKAQAVSKVLAEKFHCKKEVLIAKLNELAQEVLDSRYPTDIKLWLNSAPKGGVSTRGHFKLILNESEDLVKHFFLAGDLEKWRRQESATYLGHTFSLKSRPVLSIHRTDDMLLISDVKLLKKITLVLQSMDALKVDYDITKSTVERCLSACTTTNKLQELYPSLVKYLPASAAATKSIMVPEKDLLKVLP